MKTDRIQLMREAPVSKALFQLGIPMVISTLVTALYNVVDTYFVSGLGKQAVAAVSVAFPLSLIFSGIGLTFGAGAGSYISRLLGKKDREMAEPAASTALFTSVLIGLAAAAALLLALEPVLTFMGAIPSILKPAKEYVVLFLFSTVFSTANVAAGNLAVAQGASNISLTAMISGAVLNMILDPICITALGMGVRGAVGATPASQIVTSAIYVWFFAGGRSFLKIAVSKCRPSAAVYREILKVSASMLLLQLLSSLSMSRISAAAGPYGEDAIAAMGIVLRIVTLGVNVVFGYMKGFQPMAGFNYGAQNIARLREAIRSCLKWTTIFCVLWNGVIFLLAGPILSLLGDDPQVLAIAVPALRANTALFFTFGFQFTCSTLYLAMGKALGGVIWVQAVADILTTLVSVLFAVHIHKELRKAAG